MHHADPAEGTWMRDMKIYHMKHHYKNGVMGFGVSSRFWDRIFNTELVSAKKDLELQKKIKNS